jgi:hypothetical protein
MNLAKIVTKTPNQLENIFIDFNIYFEILGENSFAYVSAQMPLFRSFKLNLG